MAAANAADPWSMCAAAGSQAVEGWGRGVGGGAVWAGGAGVGLELLKQCSGAENTRRGGLGWGRWGGGVGGGGVGRCGRGQVGMHWSPKKFSDMLRKTRDVEDWGWEGCGVRGVGGGVGGGGERGASPQNSFLNMYEAGRCGGAGGGGGVCMAAGHALELKSFLIFEARGSWGEGGGRGTHRGLRRREKQPFGISLTPPAGVGGYVYSCIHVHSCVFISIYIYMHIHVRMCIYVHTCVYMCMCIYIYECVCVYICIYMCIYVVWLASNHMCVMLPAIELGQV